MSKNKFLKGVFCVLAFSLFAFLVFAWDFDYTSTGTTDTVAGVRDDGLSFVASNYITFTDSGDYLPLNIGVSFWYKSATEESNKGIISKTNMGGDYDFALIKNGSSWTFRCGGDACPSGAPDYTFNGYDDDTWHHIVLSISQTFLEVYVDGSYVTPNSGDGTTGGSLSLRSSQEVVFGGYHSSGAVSTFDLDEVAIFGVNLSESDAETFWNSGSGYSFSDENCLIYYNDFDGGTGGTSGCDDGSTAPTVTTDAASSIAASSATLNANITATGGVNASQKGFDYGTDPTLVSGSTHTELGAQSGIGSFNQGISGLACQTTYYFRAYATNTVGTGTGSIETFDTGTCPAPTFTANRTALNTIVLTFSENVDVTTTSGQGYAVAGATVNANTDPGGSSNTMTLTTIGLTSTSSTPAVTYTQAAGTTIGGANNEVANNFSVNAADGVPPTFTANRTALNTIVLTFTENVDTTTTAGQGYAVAGATVTANTDPAGSSSTMTLTTTGLTSTSSTPAVTYTQAAGTTVDAVVNEVANAFSADAADSVAPTFTANRSALNTIVLTFSENVDAADTATAAWTVVGATVSSVTDPNSSTTLTITSTGLTSTSSTPEVNYVAASGTMTDVSAATNEVANGGAVSAIDGVPPTFTANRTALNTIVLTFSETVNEPSGETSAWTVAGATVVTVPGVVSDTTMTITTTGLVSTTSTPAVTYVAASGNLLDASPATNEMADGTTSDAADSVDDVVEEDSPSSGSSGSSVPGPRAPLGGYLFSISPNPTTDGFVTLNFRAGEDATKIVIADNPSFYSPTAITYTTAYSWILNGVSGEKTLYAKFCNQYNRCSEVLSAQVFYAPTVSIPTPKPPKPTGGFIDSLIPDFIKPPTPAPEPAKPIVSEEAELSLRGEWNLMSSNFINNFVLAPLPGDITGLTLKFPELGKVFKSLGIVKITDLGKLKDANINLPKISDDNNFPTEILVASGGGIGIGSSLNLNYEGELQQKIETIAGKPLTLSLKPASPADDIQGYLLFKRRPEHTVIEIPSNSFVAGTLLAHANIARAASEETAIEQELLVGSFKYTDPDHDGIYTGETVAPTVEGEYEVLTVINYTDKEKGSKELRMITVVDPEGYVFKKSTNGEETRISNVKVSIFDISGGKSSLWDAKKYSQNNPQITNKTGKYSFLVPEGDYFITAEVNGYKPYKSEEFDVREGAGIHFDIEMREELSWLTPLMDWKMLIIAILGIGLVINFINDRRSKKELLIK